MRGSKGWIRPIERRVAGCPHGRAFFSSDISHPCGTGQEANAARRSGSLKKKIIEGGVWGYVGIAPIVRGGFGLGDVSSCCLLYLYMCASQLFPNRVTVVTP